MRPKVKPRQSHVKKRESFVVSTNVLGEGSRKPWRISAFLTRAVMHQPESPTSPHPVASRGRPLDLGISIPANLLQDPAAIRLAKAPRISNEVEGAAEQLAQPVAETIAETATEGGSELNWKEAMESSGPGSITLISLLENLHLGLGAFNMNHLSSALEDTVRATYGHMVGDWFRAVSETAEKIQLVTAMRGMKLGKRRAFISLACNAMRDAREEALWRRVCFGVLAIMELMVSMEAHMLPDAQTSIWPYETSTILLFEDVNGVVQEYPLSGSFMGQLPESHDVGLMNPKDSKYIQEVANKLGRRERPVTVSAFQIGLSSSESAVITLQAATLRALSDAHSKAFHARTWELLNVSNAVKLQNALVAGWDLMMALLPTYTPLALQQQLYETENTSGLHASDWVANQANQVGWSAATEQFCYHDAVSLAHCLSLPVADLSKVDTAQFNKFHLYHGWRWLKAQKMKSLTHPKGKEVSADEKARLLYEENYWITLDQWAAGLSRAKLCSFAMMGYIRKPVPCFQSCAPLLVVDGCGQEWPLHALEVLVRQTDEKLASRAIFGSHLGAVDEDDVEKYETQHAKMDRCPLHRVSVTKYIIEFSRTGASKWSTKSGRVAHCKMVCVIHLESGYLPVVALLSPYFGGETGGNGKWSGSWSGRTDPNGGKEQIFKTLVHHKTVRGGDELYDPRHFKVLNDWYTSLSEDHQASLWRDPGSQSVSSACPEVIEAGYTQIGGGEGIVDIDDARVMMWAS